MKKLGLYLLALVFMVIYWLAGNGKFMHYFVDEKVNANRPFYFRLDKYAYGDLYGLSYLSNYPGRYQKEGKYFYEVKKSNEETKGNLFIIGDSFLEQMFRSLPANNLYQTDVNLFFWFGTWMEKPCVIKFDRRKKNILLIETTERNVRGRFSTLKDASAYNQYYNVEFPESQNKKSPKLTDFRFIPQTIEQNLETMLFGYEFFRIPKELKADFSYYSFGRKSESVFVSPSQDRLFMNSTIDSTKIASSFKPLSDATLNAIVANMDSIALHYKKLGFDKVVFSIIPNPATVCAPPGYAYNQLIPRIQKNKLEDFDLIDVYQPMLEVKDPCSLYWKSDTHWNVDGYKLWEKKMNEYLMSCYGE